MKKIILSFGIFLITLSISGISTFLHIKHVNTSSVINNNSTEINTLLYLPHKLTFQEIKYKSQKYDGWTIGFNKENADGKYMIAQGPRIRIYGSDNWKYDKTYGEFEKVTLPTISPNVERFAYAVQNVDRAYVVLSGTQLPNEYRSIRAIAFSPNNARFAYVAERLDYSIVGVLDGNEQLLNYADEFDYNRFDASITFSPDSKKVFFVSVNAPLLGNKKPIGRYKTTKDETFSANKKHVGHIFCDSPAFTGLCYISINNKNVIASEKLENLLAINKRGVPIYTIWEDVKFLLKTFKTVSVRYNNKESNKYDEIKDFQLLPQFNESYLFVGKLYDKEYTRRVDRLPSKEVLVFNGVESDEKFDRIWNPQIINNNILSYAALSGNTILNIRTTIEKSPNISPKQ